MEIPSKENPTISPSLHNKVKNNKVTKRKKKTTSKEISNRKRIFTHFTLHLIKKPNKQVKNSNQSSTLNLISTVHNQPINLKTTLTQKNNLIIKKNKKNKVAISKDSIILIAEMNPGKKVKISGLKKKGKPFIHNIKTIQIMRNITKTTGIHSNKIVTKFNLTKNADMKEPRSMDNMNHQKNHFLKRKTEATLKKILKNHGSLLSTGKCFKLRTLINIGRKNGKIRISNMLRKLLIRRLRSR